MGTFGWVSGWREPAIVVLIMAAALASALLEIDAIGGALPEPRPATFGFARPAPQKGQPRAASASDVLSSASYAAVVAGTVR